MFSIAFQLCVCSLLIGLTGARPVSRINQSLEALSHRGSADQLCQTHSKVHLTLSSSFASFRCCFLPPLLLMLGFKKNCTTDIIITYDLLQVDVKFKPIKMLKYHHLSSFDVRVATFAIKVCSLIVHKHFFFIFISFYNIYV